MSQILLKLSQNWRSGLTVALVSLPLSIALSIASGAGPVPGVITAFWAGMVAAIFGGSEFNIVGPAGALTTILSGFAFVYGPENLPFLSILVGLIILLIYLFNLERYLILVPSSVIYGFATGVAILIAFGQINDALGLNIKASPHFLENLEHQINFLASNGINLATFIVFLVSFTILLTLKKVWPKVPGVIIVAILGILFGLALTKFGLTENINWFGLTGSVQTLEQKFAGQIQASLFNFPNLSTFQLVWQDFSKLLSVLNIAIITAIVAVLETLITAKLADSMTKTKFNSHKEVFGLGLANIASGIMGGLPATGVFLRTGLNVKSGATHRFSGIMAAFITGVLAMLFLGYFKYIPMAVIAAILMNTAIGLIEIHKLQEFWQEDRKSFLVMVTVATLTVLQDASIGILVGVALALLFFVNHLSQGCYEANFNRNHQLTKCAYGSKFEVLDQDADMVVYSIQGILAYLDCQSHLEHIAKIADQPSVKTVIIRMRDVFHIDSDGREILGEIIELLMSKHKTVLLSGVNTIHETFLRKNSWINRVYELNLVFQKTSQALKFLGFSDQEVAAEHSRLSKVFVG